MRHAVDSIDRVLIPVEIAVKSWGGFCVAYGGKIRGGGDVLDEPGDMRTEIGQ